MTLKTAFLAGFTRRWHTNPELSHTEDRLDAHSGRVARIILMLHPDPSARLLAAALTHDDGELDTVDASSLFKRKYPEIAKMIGEAETEARSKIWPNVEEINNKWLRFADQLDAFMWAKHHKVDLSDNGWPKAYQKLIAQATELGCIAQMENIL